MFPSYASEYPVVQLRLDELRAEVRRERLAAEARFAHRPGAGRAMRLRCRCGAALVEVGMRLQGSAVALPLALER